MAFLHSVDIIQYNSLQQNTLIWDSMNNGPHVLITLALTPRRTLNFPNSHWMGPTRLQTSGSDQSHVFSLRKFWENLSTSLTSTCSNLITDHWSANLWHAELPGGVPIMGHEMTWGNEEEEHDQLDDRLREAEMCDDMFWVISCKDVQIEVTAVFWSSAVQHVISTLPVLARDFYSNWPLLFDPEFTTRLC